MPIFYAAYISINRNVVSVCTLILILFLPSMLHADTKLDKSLVVSPAKQVNWWVQRYKQKLTVARQGGVDLVLIGDSITRGWEQEFAKDVWNQYFSEYRSLNLGFGGDRTEQVIWRIQHGAVNGISPKLVVLLIGTNNTGSQKSPAIETALSIRNILEELESRLPQSKILLMAIFPRSASPDNELRLLNNEINKKISKLADNKNIFFLDINNRFINESGELSQEVMHDYLHLTKQGYEIWAASMAPVVSALIDDVDRSNPK